MTILRENLGQTVQSFLDTNDGGRDGAFSGTWCQKDSEDINGKFVVQCKFTNRPQKNLSVSDLADEVSKAKRLVKSGECNSYILMSNAGITGKQEEKIKSSFLKIGVKHCLILGSTWVCDQIHESKRLRMLVPRLYGLGDLGQVLDERAYTQARALLDSMSDDLAKVVVTLPYREALDALHEHSFVLLIGEPAAGKTTIASLLAMASIDQWNISPLKLDTPNSVKTHWNPNEPSQFFWIDDAFGSNQYEPHLALGWNRILTDTKAMIKNGAKIVMTSRDYIYRRARKDLKTGAFPLMDESKVVINVHDLRKKEKMQILYNHMKLGGQKKEFKSEIKPYLEDVACHPLFIPEIARRLSEPVFTKSLAINKSGINNYVDKKESFLEELLTGLVTEDLAALALIYMRNGNLESPIELSPQEEVLLERLGGTLNDARKSLDSLKGTLVQFNTHEASSWTFKHPTIGDSYAAMLAKDPELLGVFLTGTSTEKLVNQITCGDIGYEKAIVITKNLFQNIMNKLDHWQIEAKQKSGWSSTWDAERGLHYFLSRRCSKNFLELYIGTHPDFIESLTNPGLSLFFASEIDMVFALEKNDLLPKEARNKIIKTITEYAIKGEDGFAIESQKFKEFLSRSEFKKIRELLKEELIPNLSNITYDHCYNTFSDQSPEEHISSYQEFLSSIESEFSRDKKILETILDEKRSVDEWLEEQDPKEDDDQPVYRNPKYNSSNSESPNSQRYFFDDVDV